MNKIKYYFKRLLCHIFIFLFSGTTYYCMEIIYKDTHTSHWSMFLLAGFSALFFIDGLNDTFGYDMDYLLQCFICSTAITIGELIVGLTLNQQHNIWDYSSLPFNYKGQICLLFYFLWMFLSAIFIPILDYIEWKWFDYEPENPPYYKAFGTVIFKFKR